MADLKISQLTGATTPLAGTEVLPIVQSSTTKKVATDDLTVKNVRSNATTGILQIAGPGTGATRTMTTPDANFTVARTDAAQTFSGDQTISGGGTYYNGATKKYYVYADGSDNFAIVRYSLAGSYEALPVRILPNNDVVALSGNFVQGTAAKGVNFTANTPAAGMTSQLLNWYEEGTFTPVVAGSTTAGTATYSLQSASYTRTGRVVYVQVALAWSGGTGTGNLTITGLPFTSANISSVGAMSIALVDALALSANNVVTAFVPANSTRIEIWQYPVAGGAANNAPYDALATVYLSGSYTV